MEEKQKKKKRERLPVDPNLDVRDMLDIERDVERETGIFKPDSTQAEDVEILRLNEAKNSHVSHQKEKGAQSAVEE